MPNVMHAALGIILVWGLWTIAPAYAQPTGF